MQSTSANEVSLTEEDIPGAMLDKPYEKQTIPALQWWLKCRGISTPSSWKKKKILDR